MAFRALQALACIVVRRGAEYLGGNLEQNSLMFRPRKPGDFSILNHLFGSKCIHFPRD